MNLLLQQSPATILFFEENCTSFLLVAGKLVAAADETSSILLQENCLLLLTSPIDDVGLLLAPFQPFKISVLVCPIDLRLSLEQAAVLVRTLCPRHILLPAFCKNEHSMHILHVDSPPAYTSTSATGFLPCCLPLDGEVPGTEVHRLADSTPIRLRLKRKFDTALMHVVESAALPSFRSFTCGISAARVTAKLTRSERELILSPVLGSFATADATPQEHLHSSVDLSGEKDAACIISALHRRGLYHAVMRVKKAHVRVNIGGSEGPCINLQPGCSTICCQDYETATLLRESLLELMICL